jgi:hypothetical protein
MTEPTLLSRAIELYKRMTDLQRRAEGQVMQLMRHPEATPEHLTTAHRVASTANTEHERLKKALQSKWPEHDRTWSKKYPWNL